jgi:hypothetical protein
MDRPLGYRIRIRVRGELAPAWSGVFGNMALEMEPGGTTVISGELGDQSAVHGLLDAIRDLGISLVLVEASAISPTATANAGSSRPAGTGPTALGSAGKEGAA